MEGRSFRLAWARSVPGTGAPAEADTSLRFWAAVMLLGLHGTGVKREAERLPSGVWGGQHVQMTVKDTGAAVVFDCAHGTVDGALLLDEGQRFDAGGVFVREHGGPVRIHETENREPARYQGTKDGSTLTLRVVLHDGEKTLGPYTLSFGQNGHVVKCG